MYRTPLVKRVRLLKSLFHCAAGCTLQKPAGLHSRRHLTIGNCVSSSPVYPSLSSLLFCYTDRVGWIKRIEVNWISAAAQSTFRTSVTVFVLDFTGPKCPVIHYGISFLCLSTSLVASLVWIHSYGCICQDIVYSTFLGFRHTVTTCLTDRDEICYDYLFVRE